MKKRIIAGLAAVTVAAVMVIGAPSPATAVYGNKVVNAANVCTTLRADGGSNFSICGLNNYAFNVSHVVVPRGTCKMIGFWSFKTYCASGKVALLVPVGSGTTYVK